MNRCESCGVSLHRQRALMLEDAELCYPCAVDTGFLVRGNPDDGPLAVISKSGVVPRLAVMRFALDMERKLAANDHKGGWAGDTLSQLLVRAQEEMDELVSVAHSEAPNAMLRTIEEAADVANFAMMIADNARRLIRATPAPSHAAPSPDGREK